nr:MULTISPECIES: hypothetical protein [unclassified Peribacillus]
MDFARAFAHLLIRFLYLVFPELGDYFLSDLHGHIRSAKLMKKCSDSIGIPKES